MLTRYFLEGHECWGAQPVPAILQTPSGTLHAHKRWGFRFMGGGANSLPRSELYWFDDIMLGGSEDAKETFCRRRCVIPMDFFEAQRRENQRTVSYGFTPARFKYSFAGVYSAIEGVAIILRHRADAWCDQFGPGMPMLLRRSNCDEYLDPATPPVRAYDLLDPFQGEEWVVAPLK